MKRVYAGTATHVIDRQRRVAIKSEWRGKKGTVFYLVPALNNQIAVLPEEEFEEKVRGPFGDEDFTNGDSEAAMEDLGAILEVCKCDSQGRITLSEDLMDYAGLEVSGTALLKGVLNSIRISKAVAKKPPVEDRAAKFLDRLKEVNKARKAARDGSGA